MLIPVLDSAPRRRITDPSQVGTLRLDLWAEEGLYQDTPASTPAAANADPVRTWQSRYGGVHFTAPSDAARGTVRTNVINGKQVVRLDGTDDAFTSDSAVTIASEAVTVFVVGKVTTKTNFGHFLGYGTSGAGSVNFRQVAMTGRLCLCNGQTNVGAGCTAASTPDGTTADLEGQGFKILEGVLSAADAWEILENGVSKDTASEPITVAGTNTVYVGHRNGSFFLNGDLRRVLLYDGALTASERLTVRQLLAADVGITL